MNYVVKIHLAEQMYVEFDTSNISNMQKTLEEPNATISITNKDADKTQIIPVRSILTVEIVQKKERKKQNGKST